MIRDYCCRLSVVKERKYFTWCEFFCSAGNTFS